MSIPIQALTDQLIGTTTTVQTDAETDSVDESGSVIAVADPLRYGLTIANISDVNITVGLDQRVAAGRGIRLVPGGSFSTSAFFDYALPSREWWASSSNGTAPIFTLEVLGVPTSGDAVVPTVGSVQEVG